MMRGNDLKQPHLHLVEKNFIPPPVCWSITSETHARNLRLIYFLKSPGTILKTPVRGLSKKPELSKELKIVGFGTKSLLPISRKVFGRLVFHFYRLGPK